MAHYMVQPLPEMVWQCPRAEHGACDPTLCLGKSLRAGRRGHRCRWFAAAQPGAAATQGHGQVDEAWSVPAAGPCPSSGRKEVLTNAAVWVNLGTLGRGKQAGHRRMRLCDCSHGSRPGAVRLRGTRGGARAGERRGAVSGRDVGIWRVRSSWGTAVTLRDNASALSTTDPRAEVETV